MRTSPGLILQALRVARPVQLRARAARPWRRRRFPLGDPPRAAQPLTSAAALWRTEAFASGPTPEESTRLGRFQREYGDDVLAAARAGDAGEAERLVAHWIATRPPRDDDAWHPYPLSTRIGNWVAALTLEPRLATPDLSRSLWRQLLRLAENLEYDVLGNHLVRNARGLVLGGVAFAEEKLVERGLRVLEDELAEQILPDGGHYERSPAYHLVVLRDLLEVQAVTPREWLDDAVGSMQAFAAAVARPDGAPPLFNDGTIDVPRLGLPFAPLGTSTLPDSGFVVVREGDLWLAFRCGPPSPPFLPAHAHADALSFQLWWRGRPVVVDPGTFTYEPGPERDSFRGTRAHSTVCVDGRDQFALWGAFRTGRLPPVQLRFVADGAAEAAVELAGGIVHVRRIEWDAAEGAVTICDSIEGSGRHRLESRLLWSPDAPPVDVETFGDGERRREAAWVSERFGERIPTTATVIHAEIELPASIGFRIRCLQ